MATSKLQVLAISGMGVFGKVANYSALPLPSAVPGQTWIALASQGTQWLPGSLGGTYYPKGQYYSDGTNWIYDETPYQASQSDVNAGTITDQFVSPSTFANATKWGTKENSITAGTTSQYWRGDKTFQTLDKNAVGLGNVDNTSDATKNSATATLQNKRIQKRIGSITSSATPTINTDNVDFFEITALATAITSMTSGLSGTPTKGQTLWIAITDAGSSESITWGTSFESSGSVSLPTSTTISTRMDCGFVWNDVTNKWRIVALA